MTERLGNWMVTATGRAFYPIDPRPDEVTIEDIAHALSLVCRFGGHALFHYSVAQHSVIVSEAAEKLAEGSPRERAIVGLWGLLHDAAEAYCGDIIWPVKQEPALKAAFAAIEDRLMRAICDRFGLAHEEPAVVKFCDLKALATEKRDVVRSVSERGVRNTALEATAAKARTGEWHCDVVEPFPDRIEAMTTATARGLFLCRFYELIDRTQQS